MSFVCPKCGSSHFGSSSDGKGNLTTGMCHDEFGVGCKYRWDRSDPVEDGKHFPSEDIIQSLKIVQQWEVRYDRICGRLKTGRDNYIETLEILTSPIVRVEINQPNKYVIAVTESGSRYFLGLPASKEGFEKLNAFLSIF